ncbi:substrate-binding periplasmic protein [Zooshikella harenae]|uniref:Transporter substrate-binding domain-containing protein n=1 Tax=Zooshikella harenae TaxID=2827238 RepID=A0ABS5ZHW3_9GAMM|nr:transporter substrate-binding domain-containing protein [Zooshikella harenae]MBU2713662.1 transporter substrate-binding domain-containing protein [Zooshikella harenae]
MIRARYCVLNGISLAIYLLMSHIVLADDISLRTDYWCPYSCEEGSDKKGVLIDIVEYIFNRKGHTLNYRLVPWKRAIAKTRSGEFNGIIGAFHNDAPDFIFHQEPLAYSVNVFFIHYENKWQYTGLESLAQIRLGAALGYSYGVKLDKYIENNKGKIYLASGETPIVDLVRLLMFKRIEVVIENRWVMEHYLKKLNNPIKILEAGISSYDPVYVGFSPVNPLSYQYANEIDQELVKMKRDGTWMKILNFYGLLPNKLTKLKAH